MNAKHSFFPEIERFTKDNISTKHHENHSLLQELGRAPTKDNDTLDQRSNTEDIREKFGKQHARKESDASRDNVLNENVKISIDKDISNSNQNPVHVYSHTNIVKRQRKPNSQYENYIVANILSTKNTSHYRNKEPKFK